MFIPLKLLMETRQASWRAGRPVWKAAYQPARLAGKQAGWLPSMSSAQFASPPPAERSGRLRIIRIFIMKLVNICKNKTQHFNLKKNFKKPSNKAGMKRYSIFFRKSVQTFSCVRNINLFAPIQNNTKKSETPEFLQNRSSRFEPYRAINKQLHIPKEYGEPI